MLIVTETSLPGLPPPRRGKVRDLYDFGDEMLIVSTDRVSAFDAVLPDPIPDKGRVLNRLAAYWFEYTRGTIGNHYLTAEVESFPRMLAPYKETLAGRSMLVCKAQVVQVECVVRGYLAGSAWKDYVRTGRVGEYGLPPGMVESERLPEPIFTPTTKAESGHDLPITFAEVQTKVGVDIAGRLRRASLDLFAAGAARAEEAGIILADTKFEFGFIGGELVVVDEMLTPDSSRFWPRETYVPGGPQPSYDKQFIRDFLENLGWDKTPPAPHLPPRVIEGTSRRYREAYRLLTGKELPK